MFIINHLILFNPSLFRPRPQGLVEWAHFRIPFGNRLHVANQHADLSHRGIEAKKLAAYGRSDS
jgi:hypothetical protein